MMRRWLGAFTLAVSTACGGSDGGPAGSAASEAVGGGESPVTGLIVDVEGTTMELEVGGRLTSRRITFEVIDPTLPPGHLQEHLDGFLPVRVHFEEAPDGRLVATLVEDT